MVKVFSKLHYTFKSGLRHGFKNVIFSKFFFGFVASLSMIISSYDKADRVKDSFNARFHDQEDTFDFIIVGSGSAGSVLANRLSQDHKVLLLEAGGEPHPLQRIPGLAFFMLNYKETDWMHRTVPQRRACFASRNKQASLSQGRNLGGTGNLNFLVHLRGSPRDYDNWAKLTGDPSWSYQELLPFFKKSENYQGDSPDRDAHGFEGELMLEAPAYTGMAKEFIRAGQELGYEHVDLNARFEEGFDTVFCPLEGGERHASFAAFLEPVRDRDNLVIRKYSHVNRVLVRGFDSTAFGVEYKRHGMKKFAYATKEIILSAGTVESAKLLMLSGIGPESQLADLGIPIVADLPVGQNIQDHLATFLGPFFVDPPRTFLIDRDITLKGFYEYKSDGQGPLSSSLFQAAALITSHRLKNSGTWNWPDIQLLLSGMGAHKTFAKDLAHAFNLSPKMIKKYYDHAAGRDSFFIAVTAARPQARGEIILEKKDSYAAASINPRYLENDLDMQIMIEGVKTALHLVENTTAFQTLRARFTNRKFPGCDHLPFRSEEYWECYVRHYSVSMNDLVGSCAMGNPDMGLRGVVNSQLEVIGINHLRVVDASIMPRIVGSHTQAAVIMIAERGAEIILEAWRSREGNFNTMPVPSITTLPPPPGEGTNNIEQNYGPPMNMNPPANDFYGPPNNPQPDPELNYAAPQQPNNVASVYNAPNNMNTNYPNQNQNQPVPQPQQEQGYTQLPPPPQPPQTSTYATSDNNNYFSSTTQMNTIYPTQDQQTLPSYALPSTTDMPPAPFSTSDLQPVYGVPNTNNNNNQGYNNNHNYNGNNNLNNNNMNNNNANNNNMNNNNGNNMNNHNVNNNGNNNNANNNNNMNNNQNINSFNNNNGNNYQPQNPNMGNPVLVNGNGNGNVINNQIGFNPNQNQNQNDNFYTSSTLQPPPLPGHDPRNVPPILDEIPEPSTDTPTTVALPRLPPDPDDENPHSLTYVPDTATSATTTIGAVIDTTTINQTTTFNPTKTSSEQGIMSNIGNSIFAGQETSNVYQNPPSFRNPNDNALQESGRGMASRPKVMASSHDTKKRLGVQISNPFPDFYYSNQSPSNPPGLISQTNLPHHPLGPVYFLARNPEFSARDPISVKMGSSPRPPTVTEIAANQIQEASRFFVTTSKPTRTADYYKKLKPEAMPMPSVYYKSVGVTNKIPSTAHVPDIYYKITDTTSTNVDSFDNPAKDVINLSQSQIMAEIKSQTPGYWTNASPNTKSPLPSQNILLNSSNSDIVYGKSILNSFGTVSQQLYQNQNSPPIVPSLNDDSVPSSSSDFNFKADAYGGSYYRNPTTAATTTTSKPDFGFTYNQTMQSFTKNMQKLPVNSQIIQNQNQFQSIFSNSNSNTNSFFSPSSSPTKPKPNHIKIKSELSWTTRPTTTTTPKPYKLSKQQHVQSNIGFGSSENAQSFLDQSAVPNSELKNSPSIRPFTQQYWPGSSTLRYQENQNNNEDLTEDQLRTPVNQFLEQAASTVAPQTVSAVESANEPEVDPFAPHTVGHFGQRTAAKKNPQNPWLPSSFKAVTAEEIDTGFAGKTQPTTRSPISFQNFSPSGAIKKLTKNIKSATKGFWNTATGLWSSSSSSLYDEDEGQKVTDSITTSTTSTLTGPAFPMGHVNSKEHKFLIQNALQYAQNPTRYDPRTPEFPVEEKPGIFDRPPFHIDQNNPHKFNTPRPDTLNTQIPDDIATDFQPMVPDSSTRSSNIGNGNRTPEPLQSNEIFPELNPETPPDPNYPDISHSYNHENINGLKPPRFGVEYDYGAERPPIQNSHRPEILDQINQFVPNLKFESVTQIPGQLISNPAHVEIKSYDADFSTTPRPILFDSRGPRNNKFDQISNQNQNGNNFNSFDALNIQSSSATNLNQNNQKNKFDSNIDVGSHFNQNLNNFRENENRNQGTFNANNFPNSNFQLAVINGLNNNNGKRNSQSLNNGNGNSGSNNVDNSFSKNLQQSTGSGFGNSDYQQGSSVELPREVDRVPDFFDPPISQTTEKYNQNINNDYDQIQNNKNNFNPYPNFSDDYNVRQNRENFTRTTSTTTDLPLINFDTPIQNAPNFNQYDTDTPFGQNQYNFNQGNNDNRGTRGNAAQEINFENYDQFPSTQLVAPNPENSDSLVQLQKSSADEFNEKLKTLAGEVGNIIAKTQAPAQQSKIRIPNPSPRTFTARPSASNNFNKNLDPYDDYPDSVNQKSFDNSHTSTEPSTTTSKNSFKRPSGGSHYDKNAHLATKTNNLNLNNADTQESTTSKAPVFGARLTHNRNKNIFHSDTEFNSNTNDHHDHGGTNHRFNRNGVKENNQPSLIDTFPNKNKHSNSNEFGSDKPFNQNEFNDNKNKPFNPKEFNDNSKPFNQNEFNDNSKPFNQNEFNDNNKPFNQNEFNDNNKPFNQNEFNDNNKPFNQNEFNNKPFNHKEFNDNNKPFNQNEFNDNKPFNQNEFNDNKPFNQNEFNDNIKPFKQNEINDNHNQPSFNIIEYGITQTHPPTKIKQFGGNKEPFIETQFGGNSNPFDSNTFTGNNKPFDSNTFTGNNKPFDSNEFGTATKPFSNENFDATIDPLKQTEYNDNKPFNIIEYGIDTKPFNDNHFSGNKKKPFKDDKFTRSNQQFNQNEFNNFNQNSFNNHNNQNVNTPSTSTNPSVFENNFDTTTKNNLYNPVLETTTQNSIPDNFDPRPTNLNLNNGFNNFDETTTQIPNNVNNNFEISRPSNIQRYPVYDTTTQNPRHNNFDPIQPNGFDPIGLDPINNIQTQPSYDITSDPDAVKITTEDSSQSSSADTSGRFTKYNNPQMYDVTTDPDSVKITSEDSTTQGSSESGSRFNKFNNNDNNRQQIYDITTDPDTIDITTEDGRQAMRDYNDRLKMYDVTSDPDTVDITSDEDTELPEAFNTISRRVFKTGQRSKNRRTKRRRTRPNRTRPNRRRGRRIRFVVQDPASTPVATTNTNNNNNYNNNSNNNVTKSRKSVARISGINRTRAQVQVQRQQQQQQQFPTQIPVPLLSSTNLRS